MKHDSIKTLQYLYATCTPSMSVLFQRYLRFVLEAFMQPLSNERHMLVMQKPTPTQVII
jgi:hypothetical protein